MTQTRPRLEAESDVFVAGTHSRSILQLEGLLARVNACRGPAAGRRQQSGSGTGAGRLPSRTQSTVVGSPGQPELVLRIEGKRRLDLGAGPDPMARPGVGSESVQARSGMWWPVVRPRCRLSASPTAVGGREPLVLISIVAITVRGGEDGVLHTAPSRAGSARTAGPSR